MTESEWMACTDPEKMLEFLAGKASDKKLRFLAGKASDRKLRLFACACCRSIWHLLTDIKGREAVEVSERFADGLASPQEMTKARRKAQNAWTATNKVQPEAYELSRDAGEAGGILITAIDAAKRCTDKAPFRGAWDANVCAAHTLGHHAARLGAAATYDRPETYVRKETAGRKKQYALQCQFLHDIFGNPFRTVALDPAWLASNDATIPKLAQQIYDERRFDDMPILADALMDAGCHDEDILSHCRQPGPHVWGCWVVDLLLGKE